MSVVEAGQRFANGTAKGRGDVRNLVKRLHDLESQIADYVDPDLKAEIGARLKRARENSPFKQRELADAADVELRTYQFWEQGRGVKRAGIEAIAAKLGIDADELWEGRDDGSQLDRIEAALTSQAEALEAIESMLLELVAERAERTSAPATRPARRRRAS